MSFSSCPMEEFVFAQENDPTVQEGVNKLTPKIIGKLLIPDYT